MTIAEAAPTLDDFPALPHDSRSLLRKYLTRSVWMQLKDCKTSAGVSLQDCILSGVANPDSEIGIYAGDVESYTVFGMLFAPIIAEFHKRTLASDPRHGDVDQRIFGPANLDPQNKFIISTRIRLARNLSGHTLRPSATRESDIAVEREALSAFANLSGDLAGRYWALGDLSDSGEITRFGPDHVFGRDDRFQEAAGLYRNWPDARGVYANDARTFFAWVNEEDHLRFISIQQNADLAAVYARLCAAMEIIARHVTFQTSDTYGYIAACPTNLGTGLRVSFRIRLPLAGGGQAFDAICARYFLEARGTAGEHSAVSQGVYDVSNRRRLGLSEAQCLHECSEGILKLIDLEKSLEADT